MSDPVGMTTFGASAPLKELQENFGFEPDQVSAAAKDLLAKGCRADESRRRLEGLKKGHY